LRHSHLRMPVLEVLGSDRFRLAIAERVAKESQTPPLETMPDLIAGALARRDIEGAIRLLESEKDRAVFSLNDTFLLIYLYCLNGSVEKIVEAVRSAAISSREIIIVDDFSQDGTRAVLEEKVSQMVDRIIYHQVNRGKGAALRSGFAAATGEIILVQDADLEYSPEDYPALLEPLMSDKADVVFGSRFMGGRPHRVLFFWHMVGNKFLTLLSNMFTN